MARMDVVLDGFVDGSIGDETNGLVITYLYQVIQSVTFPSPNGDRIIGLVIMTYLYQVIQSVTKLHPRSLEVTNNPLKGS